MKLTLAALRISSTPIKTPTALRRVRTVTIPKGKRIAPTTRKWGRPMVSMSSLSWRVAGRRLLDLLAGDDDGADQRGQEHHRNDLEGQEVFGEEGDAQGARGGIESG